MKALKCDVCDKIIHEHESYFENRLGIILCDGCFNEIEDTHLETDMETILDDHLCDIDIYVEYINK